MEYVTLANSDLVISRLALGCEPLGSTDWGDVDASLTFDAVVRALELGINTFDTADIYGLGRSERVLSQALGSRRHDAVIISKFGVNWTENPNGGRARTYFDARPQRVVEALESSLRRLRIGCIPLYLIHRPDPRTPIHETMIALRRCQEAGKIKYCGVSNFSAQGIREAHRIFPLTAVEIQYSLIERRPEQDTLPCCQELGISVLAYGSLGQGLLTGKYGIDARFGRNDRRHRLPHFQGRNLQENLRKVARLRKISEYYSKSPAQVAVRWVLENSAIAGAIVGAKNSEQVEENVGALGWQMRQKQRRYLIDGRPLSKFKEVVRTPNDY